MSTSKLHAFTAYVKKGTYKQFDNIVQRQLRYYTSSELTAFVSGERTHTGHYIAIGLHKHLNLFVLVEETTYYQYFGKKNKSRNKKKYDILTQYA